MSTSSPRTSTYLVAVSLFAGFLTLYLLTLSNNYSPDAMSFAVLATGNDLANPLFFQAEHLAYPGVPWLLFRLWNAFAHDAGALVPLEVLNAVFGAAGVALLYLFLRRILHGMQQAGILGLLGALGLGFSYGYWFHSTEAEDQIISIALVITSLLVLASVKQRKIAGPLTVAFTLTLAILFHATAVLALPAIALGLVLKKGGRQPVGLLLGSIAVLLGLPALIVGAINFGYRSPGDFLAWASSAPAHGVWGNFRPGNIPLGLRTLASGIIYPGNFTPITLAFLAVGLALIGYALYRRRSLLAPKTTLVASIWLFVVAAFNFYWAPGDFQFWIAATVALVILAAVVGADLIKSHEGLDRPVLIGGVAAVIVVLGVNLTAILPRHDLSANAGYAAAMCVRDKTAANDLIVTTGWDWASSYLPYFAHRDVLSLVDVYLLKAKGDRDKLSSILDERLAAVRAKGGRTFAVRLFGMSASEREWFIQNVGLDLSDLQLKHNEVASCAGETLWELER